MLCDIEMHHSPFGMHQNNKDVKNPGRSRGKGEEIDSANGLGFVPKKRSPCLRGWTLASFPIPVDSRLPSVRNHATISHIAVLLVALAAYSLGYENKVRFVRTFVPNFLG